MSLSLSALPVKERHWLSLCCPIAVIKPAGLSEQQYLILSQLLAEVKRILVIMTDSKDRQYIFQCTLINLTLLLCLCFFSFMHSMNAGWTSA